MDRWAIDKLDGLVTWMQRRGASLVAMHCWILAAFLAADTACYHIYGWSKVAILLIIGISIALWKYIQWAKPNLDYRDNWRITQRLNAEAFRYREIQQMGRYVTLGFWASEIIIVANFILDREYALAALDVLRWTIMLVMIYLNTSTFIPAGLMQDRRQAAPAGADLAKERG